MRMCLTNKTYLPLILKKNDSRLQKVGPPDDKRSKDVTLAEGRQPRFISENIRDLPNDISEILKGCHFIPSRITRVSLLWY